ncbi:MAG: ATP-dependent Clp protease adaptor ClpS [Bacteroidetes bacterium]|nr:ATP-dependent Clp protease adaptor ClpS [Bacteroidota bacterium]
MHSIFELPENDISTNITESVSSSLIVWNDDVNTFDWVIETLIEVCHHAPEQAEQSAWLIHSKGKYAVKNGSAEILQPMCEAILDRGIGATVETVSV